MSQGQIGTITVDAWTGEPELIQVILADISPKAMVGSVYEWSQYRAPVCEITTFTFTDDASALSIYSSVFPMVGTAQNFELIGPAGPLQGLAKVIKAKPTYPQQLASSSDDTVTQMVKCVWSLELTNNSTSTSSTPSEIVI